LLFPLRAIIAAAPIPIPNSSERNAVRRSRRNRGVGDKIAYAKGGSIDWQDFHCLCVAGQMIVATVPITFCLTINWTGPDDGVATMTQSYMAAAADVLRGAAQAVVQ
jgi:hypothetical protein